MSNSDTIGEGPEGSARDAQTVPVSWPAGSEAWFVCRAGGVVDDVMLPLRPGVTASEEEFAIRGRMRAARAFKRRHGLHPCAKVEVEFQAIETPEIRARAESPAS